MQVIFAFLWLCLAPTAAEYPALSRKLSPAEAELLQEILNAPRVDSGPFKDREALVAHFVAQGVRLSPGSQSGLTNADIRNLALAARAAAKAFRIPPAIVLCLTFRESSFNPLATAWTTTAKGIGQMTNPAVLETLSRLRSDPALLAAAEDYARELGARLPESLEGAQKVDTLTRDIQLLRQAKADPAIIAEKEKERRELIRSRKYEAGHIYNLQTNFGLAAAYLSDLRYRRLKEVEDEQKAWLTAVAAYNQGIGYANRLIYHVFAGAGNYNLQTVDRIFSKESAARLGLSRERQKELLDEVLSVRRCSARW